jgi:hypothetical protein
LDASLENVQRIVSAEVEKKKEIHKLVKEMWELCKSFVGSNADMIEFFGRFQTQTSRWGRELSELGEEIQNPPRMTDVEKKISSGAEGLGESWNGTIPTKAKELPKSIDSSPDKDAVPTEICTLTLHLKVNTGPAWNNEYWLEKITWYGADIMTLGSEDLQRYLLRWGYKLSDHEILGREIDVAKRVSTRVLSLLLPMNRNQLV